MLGAECSIATDIWMKKGLVSIKLTHNTFLTTKNLALAVLGIALYLLVATVATMCSIALIHRISDPTVKTEEIFTPNNTTWIEIRILMDGFQGKNGIWALHTHLRYSHWRPLIAIPLSYQCIQDKDWQVLVSFWLGLLTIHGLENGMVLIEKHNHYLVMLFLCSSNELVVLINICQRHFVKFAFHSHCISIVELLCFFIMVVVHVEEE